MVGSFRGLLLIIIMPLSNINIISCPSCIGLGCLTKSLLLKFTFTGIPELAIMYLSENLVFNCFDTNKSLWYLYFSPLFKVDFPMISFTAASLTRPKDRSIDFLLVSSQRVMYVTSGFSVLFKLFIYLSRVQFKRIGSKTLLSSNLI